MTRKPLLLASSSPYRKTLLERLGLPFTCASPDIDESPEPDESGESLATRLAVNKARALADRFPGHWIIGSDQVACLPDGSVLSKPGGHEQAAHQLRQSSGRRVLFLTGLALLDADSGRLECLCEPYNVRFRELTDAEIEAYLQQEKPYDCAGSFKMEGLGITLFEALEGRDPNSLVGLPLIALNDMLRRWGRNPLLENRPEPEKT
ncbi:septum formation protein Maf [Marinobacter adhaerens]|uniref:7-methyl-GTP pyrophosphatase n=1 Tax=Marinobacter salsuginis TaxID=418719 RepID=A0A5M3PJS8_9GAMM|nr:MULTISPECIES: Maf family nucleotide pyrophosphatase [Marinobacter]ODM32066.1 septum formation protein Maf [Marinobacter adhaerens]GBO82986.1 Maf-like protein [Marinobacter salsuginis]